MGISHGLDAVILAGGKSERLGGIVPPFHKPFLVINGTSLLVSAVIQAVGAGAEKIVVVASGENAMPVMQLISHHPRVRVVLSNGGPGRALYVGLEMCDNQRVLVMMSDNVFGPDDVSDVVGEKYAIGVREVSWHKALRFTRLIDGEWREGPPSSEERNAAPTTAKIWCGPLVIQRQRGLDCLEDQQKIGPVLGNLAPNFVYVPTKTQDVGIPTVVAELTSRSPV